ncbi:MAG: T9SS type A sorting domain-containing protein, partial [Bacteroidia bacterium]|nr:T9SS type A sorting domain-containing protein [Bacteroidia bacterium]
IEITFPIVDYQGGNFYMQGGTTEEAKTLEFGLDVSELLNQITPGSPARFFFSVIEDDPNNSFQGEIVSFSVMDYTAGLTEISSGFSQVPLENNDKTTVFCNATVTYTPVAITTTALDPVNAALPYSCTLQAEGGDTPYRWSKYYPYAMEQTANALPMTTAEPLSITNHNSGYATKTLEFPFPFFNNTYQTLYISANGFIFFDLQNYPWPYTHDNKMVFRGYRKIAPLDADLTTQGGGIWYEGNSEYALFRWEAFSENADLLSDYNFGVKLYPNGDIEFLYGDNSTLSTMEWYSGISDGDYINFLFSGVFDEEEIPQNSGLFFTAPDFLPQLSISSEGIVTGIIDNDQDGVHLYAAVTDNNRIQDRKSFPVTVQGLQMQTFPQTQNDSIIEFGEQVFLDVIIDNLGDFTYHNSFMTIHTDDSLVILTDSTESLGVLLAQGTTMIPNAFVFEVDTHIPDGHPIDFYGEITSDYAPYPFEFSHIAYAPVIHIQTTCFVTDNNEILPGDTAVMEIRVENSGGSGLTSLVSQLTNTDPYITFTPIIGQLPELEHYSTDTLKYSVIVRGDAHPGHLDFSLLTLTSAEEISLTDSLFFNVGGIMEGFESGDLNFLPWQTAGDQGWLVQEATSWQGDFSARNKAITDNQQSELFLEMNILTGGYLRFARKVSSENNYDYLRFFGNGQEMDKWAGEKNWEVVSYPISKGPQVFRWRYTKDHSVSTGQDCGWIDNLSFPACQLVDDVVNAGLNLMICEGDNAQLTGTAVNCAYVEWSTSGDGFFTVTDDVNTTYTPGNQDIQMQGATLTLTSYNAFGESLSDFVLMGIHPRPEVTAGTDTAICTSGTYTITEAEVNNTTSVAWSSSGDGLFDAYQSLQPTYYPGEGDYTAGQVILTLTAMGNSACNHTESDSFTLSFLPLPEADAGEDITIPFGAFTTLQGSVSGGSGPWLWHWSPEEIFVDPLVQNPETVNLEASVIISLVVTDSITGCTGMDEMIITVTGGALNVLVTLTPEEVCLGGPIQLMALPGGGSGDYSFEWSSIPPGFYSTDPAPIDTPLVTTTYSIQLSDGFNTIENSATAQVYPLPEPDLGNDQVVCAYHSTLLTPGIFESYLWSTGATTPSIEVDSTGIGMNTQEFWVRVENEHGCFKSDTVAVTFDPCTGIAPSTNTTLRIYPVPAHNKLWIETTKVPSDATIMIHDLTGRMLVKKIQKEKVSRIALDISALQAGYYLITVKTGNKRMTGKFTIIK